MTQVQFNEATAREVTGGVRLGQVKTRDGFDVTIIYWDVESAYPIAGILHHGEKDDVVMQWTREGKRDIRRNVTTNFDLVIETEGGEQ